MTVKTDPEVLYLADIADLLGVAYSTVKAYHLRGQVNFPAPAGRVDGPQAGRTRPWWRRSDVETWMKGRPGSGNYDRGERGSYATATQPRRRSGRRVSCGVCTLDVELTLGGRVRVHGPHANPCTGSGLIP